MSGRRSTSSAGARWGRGPAAGCAKTPGERRAVRPGQKGAGVGLPAGATGPLPKPERAQPEPLLGKVVAAPAGPVTAQAKRNAGCPVSDRESLRVALLAGTWRARLCLIQRCLYSTGVTVLTQADLSALARVGKALADPTRRRVLVQLIGGPGYPAELAEAFGTTRANLSNHLSCLRECGLVTATAEGRRVRYELADPRLAEGLRILAVLGAACVPAEET